MNDEYLWNKTGQDQEIANLEETLAVFRYRETAPPALPVQLTKQPRSWRFTFAFAFAGVAAVVIAVGVWFQMSKAMDANDGTTAFVLDAGTQQTAQPIDIKTVPDPEKVPAPAPARPTARPERAGNFTSTPLIVRARKTKPSGMAGLTRRERYAYERLMLALAISSSKLKLVKDAIDGVEATDNSRRQNDR